MRLHRRRLRRRATLPTGFEVAVAILIERMEAPPTAVNAIIVAARLAHLGRRRNEVSQMSATSAAEGTAVSLPAKLVVCGRQAALEKLTNIVRINQWP
jgi:hypothetical protein